MFPLSGQSVCNPTAKCHALPLPSAQAGWQACCVRERGWGISHRQGYGSQRNVDRQVHEQDSHCRLRPTLNTASTQHLASVLCIPFPSCNFLIPIIETLVKKKNQWYMSWENILFNKNIKGGTRNFSICFVCFIMIASKMSNVCLFKHQAFQTISFFRNF